jgi:hypothetical protein
MNPLIIKATDYTPYVCFDKDRNIFEIAGVSKPSNVFEFYDPILHWLENYMESPNEKTILSIHLEYLNTASAKIINYVIKKMELAIKKGREAGITWHYSAHEPDMKELGENYAGMYHVPFEYISHNE